MPLWYFKSRKEPIFQVEWEQQQSIFLAPGHVFGSTFTSGSPKKTPWMQSSGFSSSASPPAARTAPGSGRRPAWACSSAVRRCSRCGKGKAAYTSRSRWREGQSRGRSVRGRRDGCIFQSGALTVVHSGLVDKEAWNLAWWNLLRCLTFIHLLPCHGCSGKINVWPSWHLEWNMRGPHGVPHTDLFTLPVTLRATS